MAKFLPVRIFFLVFFFGWALFLPRSVLADATSTVPTEVTILPYVYVEPEPEELPRGGGGTILHSPKIFDIQVQENGDGNVEIHFKTDLLTESMFSYGLTKKYEFPHREDKRFDRIHSVLLKNIKWDVQYFFKIFVETRTGLGTFVESYFVLHSPVVKIDPAIRQPTTTPTEGEDILFQTSSPKTPTKPTKPSVEIGPSKTTHTFSSPISSVSSSTPSTSIPFVTSTILLLPTSTIPVTSVTSTASFEDKSFKQARIPKPLVQDRFDEIRKNGQIWVAQNERKFPWIILLSEILFTSHPGYHSFFRTVWLLILSLY